MSIKFYKKTPLRCSLVFYPVGVGTFLLVPATMAAEADVDLDLEAEENCTGKPAEKPRKHDSGAADLERVTDYAEEKEISSSDLQTVRAARAQPRALLSHHRRRMIQQRTG